MDPLVPVLGAAAVGTTYAWLRTRRRATIAEAERDDALHARESAEAARDAREARVQVLEGVHDAAPYAVVVCEEDGTVLLANRTARDLFAAGAPLAGRDFEAVLAACPEDMAAAVRSQSDILFSVEGGPGGEDEESYLLSRPALEVNMRRYRVYMVKQLTRELGRQEVAIWKKVIRVISHELNNSLAPVCSLLHSARVIQDKPEHRHRLEEVFDTIDERITHLQDFIGDYARFARLGPPARVPVEWSPFVEGLRKMYAFELDGPLPEAPGHFDTAQVQQAIINLLKNAHEAGGDATEIRLRVRPGGAEGAVTLSVLDRGPGMNDAVLRQATLPFYSTKQSGTGLGLPLCREIAEAHDGGLQVERRPDGGTAVHLALGAI